MESESSISIKYTGFQKNTCNGSVSNYFRKYLLPFLSVQFYTSEKRNFLFERFLYRYILLHETRSVILQNVNHRMKKGKQRKKQAVSKEKYSGKQSVSYLQIAGILVLLANCLDS